MIIENTQNIFSDENKKEEANSQIEENDNDIDNFLKNKIDDLPSNQKEKEDKNDNLIDIIIQKIKYPIIVIVLFFILSQPKLDKLINKILPKLSNTSGDINMLGILLKSVLAGLITFGSSYIV